MTDPYAPMTLGSLFCVGLAADQLGRRTQIPRATLLLICGLLAGTIGLLPDQMAMFTDAVKVSALTLVAVFLCGVLVHGVVIGLPAAHLTGRISDGKPLQIEALTIGFLTAGLAVWFGVSFLLIGMFLGTLIVNLAAYHTRAFHEIEHVQWPFMIVFFILAGAALELETLLNMGAVGGALIAFRTVSRLLGGWIGAAISAAPHAQRPLFGIALLP
ncbi:hypothetical protein [Sulfitobacter aestuariivivens]|uniref:hypothetical protein n=1 Tax=Sulfitobacter aestuariivivens TaxID=2766981 RepID=UPI001FEABF7B|nr:hypothetical protein [Sulfitobacter aestuariivivens]